MPASLQIAEIPFRAATLNVGLEMPSIKTIFVFGFIALAISLLEDALASVAAIPKRGNSSCIKRKERP